MVGRTGSGKTTLARLLVRLYDPDEGRILLGGQDLRGYRVTDVREHVATVTQDVGLFDGTIRDNLTLYDRSVEDERLLGIFGRLGFMSWYRTQPDGLDTRLRSGGTGLSAGEAQLLALSRVFLKDPDMVVLDEPTSRLDRATEALIEGALDELAAGTHRRDHRAPPRDRGAVRRHPGPGGRPRRRDGRAREARGRSRRPLPPTPPHRTGGGEAVKTWWFFWRMFLFKKWTFMLQTGSAIVSMVAIEHAVGLAQREVFDTLTGDAATSLGVWVICAVLVGLGLGHSIAFVGDEMLFRFNRFTMSTLLQGNAFDYVLRLRGGSSLPASPGEAVSRFRGDVRQAVMPMMDVDLLVANFLFFVIAMAIMARISALTAFAVFLPLFAIMVIVHAARGRIRQYREDAREAAGGVTGIIGEIFGMVETVKVSNAEGRVIDEFERVNSERGTHVVEG